MATPYEVEQALNAELERITAAQERVILAAWAAAWSEASASLFDTLLDQLASGVRITAATVVRSERLATALAQIADRLEDLAEAAGVTITSDLDDVVDRGIDGVRRLVAAQLPEAGDRRFDPDRRPASRVLDAIVQRTTEQITSTLIPVADQTYAIIQAELVRGVAVGDNPRETARRMVDRAEDHWNFGRSRAVTIARTETLDAYRAAAEESQNQHAALLAGWAWLAHLGPRTCRSCLSMHGRLFPLDEPGPKDHQQGRCARCPVVRPADGSEPDLSWVPDAEAHLASLDREDQVALLGRKGYRAWAAGDFPIESWTKTRTTDGWRDSQVPAAPGDSGGGSGRGTGLPTGDDEPFDFKGEHVEPHEVDFVRRFVEAGNAIEWIKRGSNGTMPNGDTRATSDFTWFRPDGALQVELKSPKQKYGTVLVAITDAVKGARRTDVVKRNFILSFDGEPSAALLEEIRRYNLDRTRYPIERLWVFWDQQLREIDLLT